MTKNEFITSVKALRLDFENNPEKWENKTIPEFLEAIENYADDIQGYYNNTKQNINSETANWKVFADILNGASVYE